MSRRGGCKISNDIGEHIFFRHVWATSVATYSSCRGKGFGGGWGGEPYHACHIRRRYGAAEE